MPKLTLGNLKLDDLETWVRLEEQQTEDYPWTQVESVAINESLQAEVQTIAQRLFQRQTHLMNEATIWARGIYPLLVLAEEADIQAWAGVSLKASYTQFDLEGIADGVLGRGVAERVTAPYLVVVEVKKGIEGETPIFQLYGQILAAAYLNWKRDQEPCQELFGCYTIADSWTFVRAEVKGIDHDRPSLYVEYSREYMEKLEALTILKLLKSIVARHTQPQPLAK